MVVEEFVELKNELNAIREEIKAKSEELDCRLVASWVDKTVILLEKMADRLALMDERVNALSG